jgi:hypothetical protein
MKDGSDINNVVTKKLVSPLFQKIVTVSVNISTDILKDAESLKNELPAMEFSVDQLRADIIEGYQVILSSKRFS